MAPVRSYTNWNSRTTDEEEQIEPYRKYFFICEGANTETWYFKKLIDIRKELNIHPLIDIRLLEKTEGDRDISFPRRLIEFAENQKENPEIAFDKERDKMIVVFDGDIFEEKVLDYDELVVEGEKNNILAVSNPAFELFLLLHYENSYEDDIEPNAEQIIQNEKDGHQTFIYKLLLARTGINPKKNSAIGELEKNIEIAIEQEKKINEDIHQCKGQITCNIGRIINEIRKDDGKECKLMERCKMQDLGNTQFFCVEKDNNSVRLVLQEVYEALVEKGYNPVNQIVGYIMSGDPTYITSHRNARSLIMKLERDELVEEMLTAYIKNNHWSKDE